MLNYSNRETQEGKLDVYSNDLQNLKSKALLTAIIFRFNERPILIKMEVSKKGAVMIGIKSFIECFEALG
jgi:hypothetical protein